ncbi:MAG: phage tail tube protein [Fusobacteriaceae bacterium]
MAINGTRVVNGSYGKLWIDNKEIMEVTEITASITADREDVQWGIGKDSKLVSLAGEGSFTVDKVYSRAGEILKSFIKGNDTRVTLTFQIADPDSTNEQIERWTITDVWFNTLQIAGFTKGAKVGEEFPFGFNPTLVDIEEEIK